MMKLKMLPNTSAAIRPLEPPISWPTSTNRPNSPAMSTKVLTLFIIPSWWGLKKRARPRPLRFRVDEGLALRLLLPSEWTVPALGEQS